MRDGLGDDDGLQQGAGQHGRQFGVAFGFVEAEAAARVEGEHEGNMVLLQGGQVLVGVVEEIHVHQPCPGQPAGRVGAHPAGVHRVALGIALVLCSEVAQAGQHR